MAQAEDVASRVPWKTEVDPWTKVLYVRQVDRGNLCGSYFSREELQAILAGIQRVAPRGPA